MTTLRRATGGSVRLDSQVAEGGEGRIYSVAGDSHSLAKIYTKPVDSTRRRKLIAMVQMLTPGLQKAAAWPCDLLANGKGNCVGFLMPRIHGPGDIDHLSHPSEQRIAFPTIDYGFLVHVSMNLMRAASTLHSAHCVIGDVNQSNVRVMKDGTVRFIDVDSFQIEAGGETFPCMVGTQMYTPPELHNMSLRGKLRTPNHDSFGLAVLVFQLLMFGRHPFAGVTTDNRPRTIEQAIAEGLFAYSPKLRSKITPPPETMSLASLGDLGVLFERTFTTRTRPSSHEWTAALDRVRSRLRPCNRNRRHRRIVDGQCPLCAMPRDPMFDGATTGPKIDLDGLSIGELIRDAANIRSLRSIEERCRQSNLTTAEGHVPSSPPVSNVKVAGGWLAAAGVGTSIFCPLDPSLRVGALVAGVAVGGLLLAVGIAQQAAIAKEFPVRRAQALSALDNLHRIESQADSLQRSVDTVLRVISDERDTLTTGDAKLKKELQGANDSYYKHLFQEHLRKYVIARASIPDIRSSRTQSLASFGVETAADVTKSRVYRIPGFGPHLTNRMMTWRRKCERAFPHQKPLKAPSNWIDQIRQKHARIVSASATKLRRALSDYRGNYELNDRRFGEAASELDRARAGTRATVRTVVRP